MGEKLIKVQNVASLVLLRNRRKESSLRRMNKIFFLIIRKKQISLVGNLLLKGKGRSMM